MEKTDLTYQQDRQTLVGRRQRHFVDIETGEKVDVDQSTKRVYGAKSFWKVYLMDFLMVLGIIDSKQLDILIYIVQNTSPSENLFIGTYKKISKECKVSEPTIAKVMKKLQANNFIKLQQNGVYRVNPNILMRGDDRKRQILLTYYNNDQPETSFEYHRDRRESLPEIKFDAGGMPYQETAPLLTEPEQEEK